MSHLKDRLPVPVRSSYPLPSNQLNAKNGCRRNAPLYPYLKSKLYATVIYSNVTLEWAANQTEGIWYTWHAWIADWLVGRRQRVCLQGECSHGDGFWVEFHMAQFWGLCCFMVALCNRETIYIFSCCGLLWSPYGIGQTIIFSCCGLFFFFFFFYFLA